MRTWNQPSGLASGLEFMVDSNWTPEQALAAWQLLDDLRERVWAHYGGTIQNLLHEQRVSQDDFEQDLPF